VPFRKTDRKEDKKKSTIRKDKTKVEEVEYIPSVEDLNIAELNKDETRWVIPPESTLRLYIKFFSKVPGNFESTLTFENSYNLKKIAIPVSGRTDFPSISNIPKNLFNAVKKSRPATVPECYLSKSYVLSENVFDFGPLLIGKNA
jgi:hydrocephalus-inducing protein